jgi:hypothetical protein
MRRYDTKIKEWVYNNAHQTFGARGTFGNILRGSRVRKEKQLCNNLSLILNNIIYFLKTLSYSRIILKFLKQLQISENQESVVVFNLVPQLRKDLIEVLLLA